MLRILIKTTGRHQSIPGNDGVMPEPPAMIGQLSLEFVFIALFTIAAVFIDSGDQFVRVILKIIYLCGFEPYIIHTGFFGQFFYIFYLVLIGFYHQELEYNKGLFTF